VGELTLLILRIAFLGILWAFVFAVVYALRSDLFGQKVRRLPQAAQAPAPAAAPAVAPSRPAAVPAPSGQAIAKRLVITSGAKEGLELDLPGELLTIGRSGESGLVIRDDYTSTHHARLLLWNEGWMLQDLDSTNGTYLNGQRVTTPVLVPLNTPVKIGTTTFELRR
jgi:pSer/pThr/pTyr-binding forkhead associated (FHA) protein